ncbi:hypothetical protein R1sor_025137 [Riccia sorocarpa]|uniref:FAD-binding PCMH-type domain-containing protein n=1 Tax=Riccia sorocarpa TaxID=122646 RepID=A0ABD3GBM2_9MARC
MSSSLRRVLWRTRDGREIWKQSHAQSRRSLSYTEEKLPAVKNSPIYRRFRSSLCDKQLGGSDFLGTHGFTSYFSPRGGNSRALSSGLATSVRPPPPGPGPKPPVAARKYGIARGLSFGALMCASAAATYYFYPRPTLKKEAEPEVHTVSNWSNTHESKTQVYFQPESLEELEEIVKLAHERKQKIRPVGSGLSPNGIGLCSEGMVNLALMDKILNVDEKNMQVTLQAGARVEQVVEALKPYGLTLQNFASIKEQQIGGFIQVGAHGTGATLPPVDEQVVSLKLVTPAAGTLLLSAESDPDLFYLSRCALGAVGVVAEVTLQCVPRHRLLEYTFVTNMKTVKRNHKKWISEHKHLRYMWIPDTDSVVVVQSNPLAEGKAAPNFTPLSPDEKLKHVRDFYKQCAAKYGLPEVAESSEKNTDPHAADGQAGMWSGSKAAAEHSPVLSEKELSELSFTELRDILISLDPLNKEHIVNINKIEAKYWKLSEGYRTGYTDEILGFDCGGQQWVSEVAFPVGTLRKPDLNDVKYMEEVLKLIQEKKIPAPAPIEQRWTASSRSPMSPAYSDSAGDIFSWVGVIMYLPTSDDAQRKTITDAFMEYRKSTHLHLWDKYQAREHWAKIEVPEDNSELVWVQRMLEKKYPVDYFNQARQRYDPHHVLSNDIIDRLFPQKSSTDST